jgi:tetratricopeptide (TPR) repeat protein
MINVYLFLIPAFIFVLAQSTEPKSVQSQVNEAAVVEGGTTIWQWTPIFIVWVAGIFMIASLVRFWQADVAFALGYNLDQAKEYQQAYPNLHQAVNLRGEEPIFKDELSLNDAVLAAALISQKPQNSTASAEQTLNVASSLAEEAINTSNDVVSSHPNNAVFWKTRVRLFYTLSQVDSRYLPRALDAIEKASLLAPNDARIWYNLGVLYGQNDNVKQGITAMEKTVVSKPDYRDAHYALGLFYRSAALDKAGKVVVDENLNKKAIEQMQYILQHISSKDADALKSLEDWAK